MQMPKQTNMQDKIKHVFVIMFENRSFDHMLGFSPIKGSELLQENRLKLTGFKNQKSLKSNFH